MSTQQLKIQLATLLSLLEEGCTVCALDISEEIRCPTCSHHIVALSRELFLHKEVTPNPLATALVKWIDSGDTMPSNPPSDLKALGASAKVNKALYEAACSSKPDRNELETFHSPFNDSQGAHIKIEVPEFTSLCPITGQPDFAKIVIEYTPRKLCVESKSLKLYMLGYRNFGSFHEAIVARMMRDLIVTLHPRWIHIRGEFTPRGGIPFWPEVQWYRGEPLPYVELDEPAHHSV